MVDAQNASPFQLAPMIFGYTISRIISSSVRAGVVDALGDSRKTNADLAAATDCHEDSLRRVLRALVAIGLMSEPQRDIYELTELGSYLRGDVEGSLRAHAVMAGEPALWQAWGAMEDAIRTGQSAFMSSNGKGLFDYLDENREAAATFHEIMATNTRNIIPAVLDGCDFGRFDCVVDVGGGNGTQIAAILQANPNLRGILLDLPDAVKSAEEVLRVANVEDRCEVRGGDFFDLVPKGGDALLLKNTLNDWDDERSIVILRNCRNAIAPEGKLLLIAPLMPETVDSDDHIIPILGDIEMMVTTGGKERGAPEYRDLFEESGFRLGEIKPLHFPQYYLIEGDPG